MTTNTQSLESQREQMICDFKSEFPEIYEQLMRNTNFEEVPMISHICSNESTGDNCVK